MKKKDKFFSDVYVTGSSSTLVPDIPEPESFDTMIKKGDEEHYGKNKPRREIIRGKLIHDRQS